MTTETAISVEARRFEGDGAALLTPDAIEWEAAAETAAPLQPTPIERQPSAYVRKAWENRPYGQIATVGVRAAVADGALFLRLQWLAPDPRHAITDNNVYADACAVLFPLDGISAELGTMGDEERPVHAWHWRAGTPEAFVLNARGLGTAERLNTHGVTVAAAWERSRWTVVFSRPLDATGVPLREGASVPIGVTVWRGSLGERAGLKSHTPEWIELGIAG